MGRTNRNRMPTDANGNVIEPGENSRPRYEPSEEQILKAMNKIQAGWSESQRESRLFDDSSKPNPIEVTELSYSGYHRGAGDGHIPKQVNSRI